MPTTFSLRGGPSSPAAAFPGALVMVRAGASFFENRAARRAREQREKHAVKSVRKVRA